MATAGLSRAYAVLRQLDVLRTDDILHPVTLSSLSPPSSSRRQVHGSDERGRRTRRSVGTDGGVISPSPLHLHSPSTSDRSASAQARSAPRDAAAVYPRNGGVRSGAAYAHAKAEAEAYGLPPPPSYTDVMLESALDSDSADTSFGYPPSRSAMRTNTRNAKRDEAVTASPRVQHNSHTAKSDRQMRKPVAASYWAAASASEKGAATHRREGGTHHAQEQVRHYTDHVYLRHSPLSSPHRSHVLSPVVFPALSTSEADHMLAHASSSLEDYFDKDDMPSVLASVAAAARDADTVRHNNSHYNEPISRSAQPTVTAAAVNKIEKEGPSRIRNGAPAFPLTNTPPLNSNAGDSALPMDEQSQQPRWAGRTAHPDACEPVSLTPSVERLLEAVRSRVGDTAAPESDADDGERPPNPPRNLVAAPPDPRFYDEDVRGQQQRQQHEEAPARRADGGTDLAEDLSPIEAPDSPASLTQQRHRFSSDLSSFYTAGGRSRVEHVEPQLSQAPTTSEARFPRNRSHPIPAPVEPFSAWQEGTTRNGSSDASDKTAAQHEEAEPTASPSKVAAADTEGTPEPVETLQQESEAMSVGEADASANASSSDLQAQGEEDESHSGTASVTASSEGNADDGKDDGEGEESGDFPAELTAALPFLDYLARVNAAGAPVLLKELAAMGDAWAASRKMRGGGCRSTASKSKERRRDVETVQRDEDEVVDCLALTLLLNKPAALRHITIPLLRTQLRRALRELRNTEDSTQSSEQFGADGDDHSGAEVKTQSYAHRLAGDGERIPASSATEGTYSELDRVLCAVIGLGSAASSLLPHLLQLLLQLPPRTSNAVCDVRLVGLAIRTTGAAEGLRALTRIVEERAELPHVLVAAAYGLSTYAYELAGHTSVVCVPAGALQRSRDDDALFCLVPEAKSMPNAAVEEALRPLWSKASLPALHRVGKDAQTGVQAVATQSPPPYCPTHVVIDAEAALQSLRLYIASDVFRVRRDHPFVFVLLDDALNASHLCSTMAAVLSEQVYKPIWDRMRRELHHALHTYQTTAQGSANVEILAGGLQSPLLLYSIHDFFAEEKDILFAVEAALVHALVSRSAAAFQEQALLSLSSLPAEARIHVVQPVTDFFLKAVNRYQLRHAATMRRAPSAAAAAARAAGEETANHCRNCDNNDCRDAEEAVVVAAALAVGAVCVNPLAPAACTAGCIHAVVPVLTELLRASQWRVRHAACVGLARVGPYTADPTAVVDLLTSQLAASASTTAAGPAPASTRQFLPLQPATVVWCLGQQQQGGARALLRVLQDTRESQPLQDWCAFQLADLDVRAACNELGGANAATPESDALLDELVQVLGRLIATQGALEEDTVLWCVLALAQVVHRAALNGRQAAPAPPPCIVPLQTAQEEQEAATYYQDEPLNSCFTVLTSVMEAALLPTNVLKALCLYLCHYGGAHGELYVCEMLLESPSVAARSAAAFGLRACGPKVVRSVVLGMNDASFEVRREALDTMEALGAARVLAVLRQRPAEHRRQVLEALRDCLLQDAGRAVARRAADTLYRALARGDQEASPVLIA